MKTEARAARPRGFTIGRTLAIVFATTAALGIIAELGARVDDRVRAGVPFMASPDLEHDLILLDSLGPRGMPNGHFEKWKLNSAGFRSDESALYPKTGCARVMTLGSSETFGLEEDPGKEYPAQLSDSLGAHGCFQVLSAAIPGISLRGMIQYWNSWASRFTPDIVVVVANPTLYLSNNPPAFTTRKGAPARDSHSSFYPRLLVWAHRVIHYPDFIQHRRVQRQLNELTAGHPREWFFSSVPDDRLRQYRADLDSLVIAVRAIGAEPILVVHPMRFGANLDFDDESIMSAWRTYTPRASSEVMLAFEAAADDAVRDVGRARRVAVVDLARTMNGHHEWFVDFVHYTDTGASVVAHGVAVGVRDALAGGPARADDLAPRDAGLAAVHDGARTPDR